MAFRPFQFREKDNPEVVKPFLDHLEDLRWMLIKMAFTLVVTMGLSFLFRKPLFHFLQQPLSGAGGEQPLINLMAIGVADSMTVSFTLAFYAGVVLGFPILLYLLASFIVPALTTQERRYVWPAVGVSFGLFLLGVTSCFHWVLPPTLRFFAADASGLGLRPSWTVDQYFSFVTNFTLAFGLSFELPVIVIILVKMGLLNYAILRRSRSYAVVGILIFAAVIAPPEILTMMTMAAPMLILYETTIWIAYAMERRERQRQSTETAHLAMEKARLEEELRRQQGG